MKLRALPINGAWLLETELHVDGRGFFARTFDAELLRSHELCDVYPQHSVAHNVQRGTIRGLHFQRAPDEEEKIVRCIRGAIFDVVLDMRTDSSTFGRWCVERLDDREQRALYVPRGCAHGYQTLVDDVDVAYLISQPYAPESAAGVHYADPELAIRWPLPVTVISERDRQWPAFREASG